MLRAVVQQLMARVEHRYRRRNQLHAVGHVLLVGRVRYQGPEKLFPDGTLLRPDDIIGKLHFSNPNIAALGEGGTQLTGFRFARLMRESLRLLVLRAHSDQVLSSINVYTGVTWIPAHGDVVGFISEPLPRTWRNWWLAPYFRFLSWTFSPSARKRERRNAEPRVYWVTRSMLAQNLKKLSKGAADGAQSEGQRAAS